MTPGVGTMPSGKRARMGGAGISWRQKLTKGTMLSGKSGWVRGSLGARVLEAGAPLASAQDPI